jgi:hypothetical protein
VWIDRSNFKIAEVSWDNNMTFSNLDIQKQIVLVVL